MSTDKADPSKNDATISSADDLVKTTKSGDVELNEEQLNRVTGGKGTQAVEFLKITMKHVTVSSV
jgi:hypothetical protein